MKRERPKVSNNISYQTLSGRGFAKPPSVKKKSVATPSIPSPENLELYRLRREVAHLRDDKIDLNEKLTRCLNALTEEVRELRLAIYDRQPFDMNQRMIHLQAHLDLINRTSNVTNPNLEKLFAEHPWFKKANS